MRDPQVHREVIESVFAFTLEKGFEILNLDFSPIRGPEGNIEYLMHLLRVETRNLEDPDSGGFVRDYFVDLIRETVGLAHKNIGC